MTPEDPKPAADSAAALRLRAVGKSFRSGPRSVTVLRDLDLELRRGERVAITGASGCGKSTLLGLAAGLDRPDQGRVEVLGAALDQLGEPALTRFRARHIGLVFQDYNLIDSLSVSENIALPLWLIGRAEHPERIRQIAATLGIDDLLARLPDQLSGGEKQRVAIARALVHEPELLLADEPTGSLDERSAEKVLALFDRATADQGCALVLVTHNPAAAAFCNRQLHLRGGRLGTD